MLGWTVQDLNTLEHAKNSPLRGILNQTLQEKFTQPISLSEIFLNVLKIRRKYVLLRFVQRRGRGSLAPIFRSWRE